MKPQRKWILVLVGLLFIAIGAGGALVSLFGERATATVTKTYRAAGSSRKSVSATTKYRVHYQFPVEGSGQVSGNFALNQVRDPSELPPVGSAVEVRYWGLWPRVNFAVGHGLPALAVALICGVGGVLLWAALSRERAPSSAGSGRRNSA